MTDADKYMEDFYNGDPLEWKEEGTEKMWECGKCDGTGKDEYDMGCYNCKGTGQLSEEEMERQYQSDQKWKNMASQEDDYIDGSDVPKDGFYESNATDEYEVDVDEYLKTGEPVQKVPTDKRSDEAETSDAEYQDWIQQGIDEDNTRHELDRLEDEQFKDEFEKELEEETVEESFGDCGCKMTNKAKETWEGLTDSDKQLELRDMGVDEGYAYYPFEHLPKKIGEAFVDKFNIEENGDSLGWNKITALERADTLRKIGFTPRDSELVSNLEYQQLSESLKKDVNEALNYKVKAQESQVPQDKSQEAFENGLYSNMYDGYLERRGSRVESKKKQKILENNNFGLDISKVKGLESKATETYYVEWDNTQVQGRHYGGFFETEDMDEAKQKAKDNDGKVFLDGEQVYPAEESKASEYGDPLFGTWDEGGWFFGITNMTRDDYNGGVYWKGTPVEHFDHDKWQEGDWVNKMRQDAKELERRILELEAKNIPVNISSVLDSYESKANEDGGYANFGSKSKENSWSVLTNASDLWFFETRDEAEDYVRGFPEGSYQINPPQLGESKATEKSFSELRRIADDIWENQLDRDTKITILNQSGVWWDDSEFEERADYSIDQLGGLGLEPVNVNELVDIIFDYADDDPREESDESKATERDFYRSNKEISDQGDDIQAEAEFGKKYSELSDSEKGYIEYIKNEFGDVKSYDEWVTSGEEGYQVKCDNCDGSGEDDGVCKQCNGKGYNEWGTYGTEAQVMGTPMTNYDRFGREWGFSIINHGYGEGSETPYEVGIFLHDEIHKKNDVKGWLNEEEALYYKAKFEVDPIDAFRSIGGQMDSIVNPDFVEQTEDNWNLWESLQDSGEASLSDPDNKKYNMDTDFGFSFSDKDIEALDAETDVELSVDNEANQNRDEDGQFTSDLPEEKNEDYGRDPYRGKVDVPFVEAKESKSKAEEAFDKGASAEEIYSLVDDKGTDDDRSESEEEYLNNLYNKTNANKSAGFSDLQ